MSLKEDDTDRTGLVGKLRQRFTGLSGMGNCCGKSAKSQTNERNNLKKQGSRRERTWKATGQIIVRDAGLQALPDSISDVGDAARVLDATNNKLKTLPESVTRLTTLQRLVLSKNHISTLPAIETLTNLKVLILDSNRLAKLPTDIGLLEHLEALNCCDNILTSLPRSLGKLKALRVMNASHNKIITVPEELGNANSLEELNLSENYIKEVPLSFQNLKNLRTLDMDGNGIKEIPPEVLKGCLLLQKISFIDNPLRMDDFSETDGYDDFENRRKQKVDKQLAGGAIHNLNEGVTRSVAPPPAYPPASPPMSARDIALRTAPA